MRKEGDSVPDSAERCRKRPRPSIQTPAGNRPGRRRRRRRIHPEPRRDFSACWSMDTREGGRGGGQTSRVFADVKS